MREKLKDLENEITEIEQALEVLGEKTEAPKSKLPDIGPKQIGPLEFEAAYTLLTERTPSTNKRLNKQVQEAIEKMDKVRIGARDWTPELISELQAVLKDDPQQGDECYKKKEKKALLAEGFATESPSMKKPLPKEESRKQLCSSS